MPETIQVPDFILRKVGLQELQIDDLNFRVANAEAQVAELNKAISILDSDKSNLQQQIETLTAKLAASPPA